MADENISGQGQQPGQAPPPAGENQGTPPAVQTPPSQPTQAPAEPVQQAQPTAQQQASFRESFGRYGYDTSRYQSDDDAMRAVAEQMRVLQSQQHFAQLGQQAMPYWGEFQKFIEQQKQQQAAQQAQQSKWWNAPDYDPAWANHIERDPQSGELRLKANAPPDALQNLLKFRDFKAESEIKFFKDPIGTLKPGLEPLVKEIAQRMIQEQLGGYQQQTVVEQLHRRDAPWLYETDEKGQVRYGLDGKPQASIAGRIFDAHTATMLNAGMTNKQEIWEIARKATYADLEMAKRNGQQGQVPAGGAAPQQTNGPINRLQTLGTEAANGGTAQGANTGLSLAERLRQDLQREGITDASFR
jgi:hypothetical protein